MQKLYTGECPYINDTHSIHVKYLYVQMIGTLTSNYKRAEFDCTYSAECPDKNNCPIYQKAPRSITG